MPRRWGLGPVFAYEMITGARRWQVFAARAGFVLILLTALVLVWLSYVSNHGWDSSRLNKQQMAELGTYFFYALAGVQISLILLASPAAAAGSICIDRARGTLLHMMVTDLSDGEIVLGKIASRLTPAIGLVACAVPVAALGALLGGIDFEALAALFVVSISLAILGCSLALAISSRARKVHEVLMAVYAVEGIWLCTLPLYHGLTRGTTLTPPAWLEKANPFVLVFAPYTRPGFADSGDFAAFFGISVVVSGLLVALSIVGLRGAVLKSEGRKQTVHRRRSIWSRILPSLPGPTLDGNPILWREWHRNRPSRLSRFLWLGLAGIAWGMVGWGMFKVVTEGVNPSDGFLEAAFGLQVTFGFLMLSATSPTALSEERVQGSLDVLLATPLSTRSIVLAKWWGTYRLVLVLAILPLFVISFLAIVRPDTPQAPGLIRFSQPAQPLTTSDRINSVACFAGDFLASGALIVSLGLLIATWVSRLGRAIGLSVTAYFLMAIAWIALSEMIGSIFRNGTTLDSWYWRNRWFWESMTDLSLIAGSIDSISIQGQWKFETLNYRWMGLGGVILIKTAGAAFLLWLTVKTFDRSLGRVREQPQAIRVAPAS